MVHPSMSSLSADVLESALELARTLREASEELRALALGPGVARAGGGRSGDAAMAMRRWVGPHRDTFERLHHHEQESARLARSRLDEEADAWAGFWADATNARREREYELRLADHRTAVDTYERASAAYDEAINADPSSISHRSAPARPEPPSRPVRVTAPTAATAYHPTG